MKPNPRFIAFVAAIGCTTVLPTAAATKSATGTDLTVSAAWDALPGSGDVATWTTGSLGAGLAIGTNVSWAGISISDALTNVGITGAGSLTLGTSGVTLTGNKTLTVGNAVVLGSSQTWSIADVTASTADDAAFSGVVSGSGFGITKSGAGTLLLTGASTFTGNVVVSNGNLRVGGTANNTNPTATSLGNMTTAGKTVTVNSGGTLTFTSSDGWGQYNYKTPVKLIADGGTITRIAGTTTFNSIGDVELKNGGRLTTTNGNAGVVGSFGLNGNVTVSGTSGSFIDTLAGQTSNSYINLGTVGGSTTFDVAATGDATADLTVSAVLGDKVLGGAANLIKTGAGKMAVSGTSTYTGTTTVSNGILSLKSAAVTTLNTLSIASGATLSTDVASGTNQRNLTGNLTLTGGTLGANSNVSNTAKGQFYMSNNSQQVVVSGDVQSTIAAEMHFSGLHTFSVADGAAPVDLLVSGKLSHEHLVAWGAVKKTGAGTMSLTSSFDAGAPAVANGLAGFELGGGTLMFSGSLGYSGLSGGASKGGYYLADFSANTTLKWATGNTFDPTVLGNLRIRDAVTATFDTNGNNVTFGSAIINGVTGTGALTKTGSGALTLSATNIYTGTTTVNGGSLLVNGSLAAGSAVSIGNGGTLGGSGTVNGAVSVASGGTLTGSGSVNGAVSVASGGSITAGTGATTLTLAGGLTLGTGAGHLSTLNITPRTAGLTPSLNITLNNGLVANGGAGSSTINIQGAAPTLGTYTLIDYAGTLGGGFGSFTLGTLPSRVLASLVDNAGNTSIDLNVTGVDWARWSGAFGTEWSTAAITNPKNWVLNSDGITKTDYIAGDTVRFDDTATGYTVDISAADVAPSAIIFDHTTNNYLVTGSKKITGTTGLTKTGTGTLTISNTGNDYSGTTGINGGKLAISGTGALGATTAALTLGGGGLDLGGTSQTVGAVSITAPAASGNTIENGTLAGTSYAVSNATGTVTLTANLAGGSATLAKSGAGTLSLTGVNTFTGAASITAGTVEIGGAGQLNGGAYAGAISNAGTLSINSTANQALSGVISGAGALIKASSGTLTLSGASTLTGNVTVNGGNLNVGLIADTSTPTATALGDMTTPGKTVTVNSGGTLTFTARDAIGSYNYKTPVSLIADGGTITRIASAQTFNSLGDVTLKNGAHLTTTNGNHPTVGSFAINGNVTVNGSSGSFIDTLAGQTTNSHINLGTTAGSTTFDVASTGDATADLTVSAVLGDKVLGGAAQLIKTGAGKMVISGTNTYTGATTINTGTLSLGTTGSIAGSSLITVATSAVLDASGITGGFALGSGKTLQGTGTVTGGLTTTGTVAPGNSIGTLNITGDVIWKGASSAGSATNWKFELAAATGSADKLAINGGFNKNTDAGSVFRFDFLGSAPNAWGNTYTLVEFTSSDFTDGGDFSFTGLTGNYTNGFFTLSASTLAFTAIPEPTSALAGLLIGAGLLRRRRR